jgi:hypothetical protein
VASRRRTRAAFGKTLGTALKKAAENENRKAIERQELKAQEYELKAGKTFRRTKKHLRKAKRHQRRADRMKGRS